MKLTTVEPVPKLVSVPLPTIPLPSIQLTPYLRPEAIVQEVYKRPPRKILIDRNPTKDPNITRVLPPPRATYEPPQIVESTGEISLPYKRTIVSPIKRPTLKIVTDSAALALAYNPKQNILGLLPEIDETRLVPGRASGAKSYSLSELKDFAKRLGLKSSASKDKLISDIKALINDFRSVPKK